MEDMERVEGTIGLLLTVKFEGEAEEEEEEETLADAPIEDVCL